MNPYTGHETQVYGIEEYRLAGGKGDRMQWEEEDGNLLIRTRTADEQIFGRKLLLSRTFRFPIGKNEFSFTDEIENRGDRKESLEIRYHMNMGYPLLDEDSIVRIASEKVIPRNDHAAEDIRNWMKMEKPTAGYEERCYYHEMKKQGHASIFQPKRKIGLAIDYNAEELDCFVEWKMMGVRDYVLGLECGNAYPDGRNVMREKGILKFLAPGEKKTYSVRITMMETEQDEL